MRGKQKSRMITNVRPALDEPFGIAAWYIAAVIVLVVLLIGIGLSP